MPEYFKALRAADAAPSDSADAGLRPNEFTWNNLYQNALTHPLIPNSRALKMVHEKQLRDHIEKFEKAAEAAAITIVSELHKENDERSIPSINAGGVAGGSKYRHNDIFFKVADNGESLYGKSSGYAGSSRFARRASSCEGF